MFISQIRSFCKVNNGLFVHNSFHIHLIEQCWLPDTVRCLSHPSAHVRTLSTSVLRAILHVGLVNPIGAAPNIPAACGPAYQYLNVDVTDWESDVGKCLTWEAHSRIATGMPIQYLNTAAKELGCPISI